MTQTTQGYVNYVGSNDWRGKTLYSLRLKNEERWYNCGTDNPGAKKGDQIKFEYEEKDGKYNVKVSSIVPLGSGTSSVSTPESRAKPASAGSKDGYWDDRLARDIANDDYKKSNDLRIQYQSARNAAIHLVDVLTREKALKLPVKDPAEAILGKIEDLTNEFFDKCSNFTAGDPVPADEVGFDDDASIPFGDKN